MNARLLLSVPTDIPTRLIQFACWMSLSLTYASVSVADINDADEVYIHSQPHIEVELIAEAPQDGHSPPRVGVVYRPAPGWHVYWKNPGDSGLPMTIKWCEGMTVDDLNWPSPESIPYGPLINLGYKTDALIWASYKINQEQSVISARTTWLACKDECVPGGATLVLDLASLTDGQKAAATAVFDEAKSSFPQPFPLMDAKAEIDEGKLKLAIYANTPQIFSAKADSGELPEVEVFIENQDLVEYGDPEKIQAVNNMLIWEQNLSEFKTKNPERVRAVIVVDQEAAYNLEISLQNRDSI